MKSATWHFFLSEHRAECWIKWYKVSHRSDRAGVYLQCYAAQQYGVNETKISPLVRCFRGTRILGDHPKSKHLYSMPWCQDRGIHLWPFTPGKQIQEENGHGTSCYTRLLALRWSTSVTESNQEKLWMFHLRTGNPYISLPLRKSCCQCHMQWLLSNAPYKFCLAHWNSLLFTEEFIFMVNVRC